MNWTEIQLQYPRHYVRDVPGADNVRVRRIDRTPDEASGWRSVEFKRGALSTNTTTITITVDGDDAADAAALWLERIGNEAHEAMLREVRRV